MRKRLGLVSRWYWFYFTAWAYGFMQAGRCKSRFVANKCFITGKLEDIATLNLVLGFKPHLERPVLPKLTHEKVDISLKYILQSGKGSVSELTARWLTTCGIGPQQIVINDKIISHGTSFKH